jgi:hypothetical protein
VPASGTSATLLSVLLIATIEFSIAGAGWRTQRKIVPRKLRFHCVQNARDGGIVGIIGQGKGEGDHGTVGDVTAFWVKWMPVRVEAMPALPGCGPANGDPIIGPGNHNRRRCTRASTRQGI